MLRDLTILFLLQGSEEASRSTCSFRSFGQFSDEEGPTDHVGGNALSGLLAVGSLEVLRSYLVRSLLCPSLVAMKLAFQREVRADVHVHGKGVREMFAHCNAVRREER